MEKCCVRTYLMNVMSERETNMKMLHRKRCCQLSMALIMSGHKMTHTRCCVHDVCVRTDTLMPIDIIYALIDHLLDSTECLASQRSRTYNICAHVIGAHETYLTTLVNCVCFTPSILFILIHLGIIK